jgi:hypothetical protein
MKTISDLAIRFVKSKLFGPKDYFERQKKRLVRSMIVPLILIIGTPSIVVASLSSFRYINFEGQGVILQLVGEASNDVLILAASLVTAFVFALGANLLYGFRLARLEEKLADLKRSDEVENSYKAMLATYKEHLLSNDVEKAVSLGSYMCRAFPDESRLDPEFITSLVDSGAKAEILLVERQTETKLLLDLD